MGGYEHRPILVGGNLHFGRDRQIHGRSLDGTDDALHPRY